MRILSNSSYVRFGSSFLCKNQRKKGKSSPCTIRVHNLVQLSLQLIQKVLCASSPIHSHACIYFYSYVLTSSAMRVNSVRMTSCYRRVRHDFDCTCAIMIRAVRLFVRFKCINNEMRQTFRYTRRRQRRDNESLLIH